MKSLTKYLEEKLIIKKIKGSNNYKYFPQTKEELKEIISKRIKEEGNKNDLLERIASDPVFNLTIEQLNNLLTPQNYIGMAKEQTEEFLSSNIRPILEENSNSSHLNLNVFV